MIKLAVSGCCGKMGRRIIALACEDKEFNIAGAIEEPAHQAIGKKLSRALGDTALDIKVSGSAEVIKEADVLIEFTNPSATLEHLTQALKYKKAAVIGTTGLDERQKQKIKEASSKIPILFSPNMSLGVNLIFRLVKQAAEKLGQNYKVDIQEAHHVHKKDAPSGTAKRLTELIKQSPGRKNGDIKIDSIREGEIIGEHTVRFESAEDVIVIRHSAKTRDIFAQGALEAAKFIVKQKPGLYDIQDVLSAN